MTCFPVTSLTRSPSQYPNSDPYAAIEEEAPQTHPPGTIRWTVLWGKAEYRIDSVISPTTGGAEHHTFPRSMKPGVPYQIVLSTNPYPKPALGASAPPPPLGNMVVQSVACYTGPQPTFMNEMAKYTRGQIPENMTDLAPTPLTHRSFSVVFPSRVLIASGAVSGGARLLVVIGLGSGDKVDLVLYRRFLVSESPPVGIPRRRVVTPETSDSEEDLRRDPTYDETSDETSAPKRRTLEEPPSHNPRDSSFCKWTILGDNKKFLSSIGTAGKPLAFQGRNYSVQPGIPYTFDLLSLVQGNDSNIKNQHLPPPYDTHKVTAVFIYTAAARHVAIKSAIEQHKRGEPNPHLRDITEECRLDEARPHSFTVTFMPLPPQQTVVIRFDPRGDDGTAPLYSYRIFRVSSP